MARWKTGIIFILAATLAHAQIPLQFSHIFSSKEMINPAYAVYEETFALKILSRSQWQGLEGNPITSGFTFYSPLRGKALSIGSMALNLVQGSMVQSNISGFADVRLRVSENSNLAFGLQAGCEYNYFDFNKMISYYKIDRSLVISAGYENLQYYTYLNPTFGSGLMLYNNNYFASVSSFVMINGNKLQTIKFYQGTYFMGGYVHALDDNWRMRELMLYKLMRKQNDVIEVGLKALYTDQYAIGTSYRHNEYINISGEMKLNQKIRLGLGYDIQTGPIRRLTYGSFEVRLEYRNFNVKRQQRTNVIQYMSY